MPLQEEFVRQQGPYSEDLLKWLEERESGYEVILFMTYLFPTTYFGMLQVAQNRRVLVPTLHREPAAYLPIYKHMARGARALLWNSKAEQHLGERLWGRLPGRIVSMGVDTRQAVPFGTEAPYILYCGRLDPFKGCREMIDQFCAFKRAHPSSLRLILTGMDELGIEAWPEDVEFRGFVSTDEKLRLMAGARVFVMPSAYESLSIVTLEAMAQETPVLVNRASEVLTEHAMESGGGLTYVDYETFARALEAMLTDEARRREMGRRGREYVVGRYDVERVREALKEEVRGCVEETSEL